MGSALIGILGLIAFATMLVAGIATSRSLARGTWQSRSFVVAPPSTPYRQHPGIVGIANAYAEAPSAVQWASIVSVLFGTAFIPGACAAIFGIAYEVGTGHTGMACTFGISGTILAGMSFVLGIRILAFRERRLRLGTLFVLWTILHNVALLSAMALIQFHGSETLRHAKLFAYLRADNIVAIFTFVYALCSLGHAALVNSALRAHARFAQANVDQRVVRS